MKIPRFRINPLQLIALGLFTVPVLIAFGLGMLWLWQTGNLHYWFFITITCSSCGYGLQQWLALRERKLLTEAGTEPNPEWPPDADTAWQQIKTLAETCDPHDWPLEDGSWILELSRRTLETVARCYHPSVEKPLLELTIPHTLLIIERASRDLRQDVTENIPFSNRLTIGDLFRIKRWKNKAEKIFNVYRAGRMIVNPANALLSEAWRHLQARSFGLARSELHSWFLRAYIRKIGYYAIDLYSGRLPLDDGESVTAQTPISHIDMEKSNNTKTISANEEPLRILILGRSNAGKSSLINALFKKLTTPADVLPDTTQMLTPFVLSREGFTQALIFDSPGCNSPHFDFQQMQTAVLNADLILWVTPVHRPDRQIERDCLDALRTAQSQRPHSHPAPVLIAASHIDLLRPANLWHPPYNLVDPQNTKAINIRAAIQAIAIDLAVPVEQVIPVCLMPGQIYNVDDTLWAALLHHQDEALKVRLLRCLDAKKQAEDWVMLRRQLISAGRFLWQLPDRFGTHIDK